MNTEELAKKFADCISTESRNNYDKVCAVVEHSDTFAHALLSGELGVRVIPDDEVGVKREDLKIYVNNCAVMCFPKLSNCSETCECWPAKNRLQAALKDADTND